ncbi:MAG: hypothetical protein HRT56_03580, partial [Coraliomargarita sp.]|nr:hypothetical protein [Coraliomargarita sp.]
MCFFNKLLAASCGITSVATASAATFYVDANVLNGNGNGSSWANAYTNLNDALAVANEGDQIWVAEGSYYPDEGSGQSNDDPASTFTLINGVDLLGGFPSGGGNGTLTARSPQSYITELSGDLQQNDNSSDNADHVLSARSMTSVTTIDGFTISDGSGRYGSGLIAATSSSLTLRNCKFQNNHAATYGGAIHAYISSLALINCSFLDNSAGSYGGAIDTTSSATSTSQNSLTLTNCLFQNNSATYDGGAIYASQSYILTLTNCSFEGNTANTGGAILATGSTSLTLINSLLWNNGDAIVGNYTGLQNLIEGSAVDGTVVIASEDPIFV